MMSMTRPCDIPVTSIYTFLSFMDSFSTFLKSVAFLNLKATDWFLCYQIPIFY